MRNLSRNVLLAATAALAFSFTAASAFAECDEGQETQIGKAIASAAAAKITPVLNGTGKQMLSLETCDAAGAKVSAEFKYNIIGADGLYWAEGKAKLAGGAVAELTLTKLSPNLASASASKGVKLAAN
ncbi:MULTISPECIES: hypothetical protein [Asticcacaulis]|uniref:hypothetical protein n=1 Tax=Asticcacaulis TaxID=76890 RepID=UPI001AE542AC|nr:MULTISPECIES: hypothetical protein [Asticcacaulis]MBP2157735.1 hypothetical protein [Asticcacaulis solisilvae]MDR6798780.1 hypothetical protein [Asticcacaulis sp. BE141]